MKKILLYAAAALMLLAVPAAAQQYPATATNTSSQRNAVTPTSAICAGGVPCSSSAPLPVSTSSFRYQLLGTYGGSGSSTTGSAVGPVQPGAYVFACSGTIGGGTITLQVLGPDGVTFQTVSGISFTGLPSAAGVVMPSIVGGAGSANVTAANAKAVLTGASGASVFCSLS